MKIICLQQTRVLERTKNLLESNNLINTLDSFEIENQYSVIKDTIFLMSTNKIKNTP